MPQTRLARILAAVFALFFAIFVAVGSVVSVAAASASAYSYDRAPQVSSHTQVAPIMPMSAERASTRWASPAGAGPTSGASTALAAEAGGQVAPDLANLSSKIEGDLVKRGWTPQEIQDAYANGEQIPAVNKANGAAATRYVNPTTGKSVVIENDTGQVIHLGGSGFKYGPDSGDLP